MAWMILFALLASETNSTLPINIERAVTDAVKGSDDTRCDGGVQGEITICAHRGSEAARFRLPLKADEDPKAIPTDRSQRLKVLNDGRSGTGVCAGAVGSAGFTGCSMHEWKRISGKE